ncbi:methylenetetrahydrofolate reductase [Spirochaetia bacterium]|nr:methylenetetrahydrofolate reductase [Spirochaetia bacterium]
MKIAEILKERTTFSFEVFPPKAEQPLEPLLETLDKLYRFEPDFVSCTYGSGGTNKGRSLEICAAIKQSGHEPVAHFTCIGNHRDEITRIIGEYTARGIENFLVMRGDFPPGQEETRGDFDHADQLTAFLRKEFPDICMAGAGYVEKHITAPSFDADITHLRSKQDTGASFIMLQLCHDVAAYERYIARIRRAGIHLPVILGLMPVLARDSIINMTVSNGCSIPAELAVIIGKYSSKPTDDEVVKKQKAADFKKAGIEYTVNQIHRFMAAGIEGLHIYTLNKWEAVSEIVSASGVRAVP